MVSIRILDCSKPQGANTLLGSLSLSVLLLMGTLAARLPCLKFQPTTPPIPLARRVQFLLWCHLFTPSPTSLTIAHTFWASYTSISKCFFAAPNGPAGSWRSCLNGWPTFQENCNGNHITGGSLQLCIQNVGLFQQP